MNKNQIKQQPPFQMGSFLIRNPLINMVIKVILFLVAIYVVSFVTTFTATVLMLDPVTLMVTVATGIIFTQMCYTLDMYYDWQYCSVRLHHEALVYEKWQHWTLSVLTFFAITLLWFIASMSEPEAATVFLLLTVHAISLAGVLSLALRLHQLMYVPSE